MLVLICGDRNWTNREAIRRELSKLNPADDTIMHGAARGADSIAGSEAKAMGFTVRSYPAQWDTHGRSAGPIRNRLMLSQGPQLVLAFHPDITTSKGTKDMVMIARKAGIETKVYNA